MYDLDFKQGRRWQYQVSELRVRGEKAIDHDQQVKGSQCSSPSLGQARL
jgi:hypothetical protein